MKKDWTNFRKDNFLSAKSELLGGFKNPEVVWSDNIGGYVRDLFTIKNSDGTKDIIFAAGGRIIRKNYLGQSLWQSSPKGVEGISFIIDIDNDGIEEIGATNGRELFIYSSLTGELLFSHYFGPPLSSGALYSMIIAHNFDKKNNFFKVLVGLWSSRYVLVFDFKNGSRNGYLQHKIDVKDGFHPTVLATDIDNCGKDEIIVTKRGAIYFIDSETGEVKKSIDWISGGERRRNYGFFQIADVNKDGKPECVVASSLVTRHISMIEVDNEGNMNIKWDRFIEHIYPTDTTEVRHCFSSLKDVDGDGFEELVLSIFNSKKDNKWYTEIINPVSGEIKYSFENVYIWGLHDIDNDGIYEIFASTETKRTTDKYSTTFILKYENGVFNKKCINNNTKFATRFINSKNDLSIFRLEFLPDDIFTIKTSNGLAFPLIEFQDKKTLITLNFLNGVKSIILNKEFEKDIHISLIDDLDNDGFDEIVFSDALGYSYILKLDGNIIAKFEASTSLPTGMFGQNKPAFTPITYYDEEQKNSYFLIPNLYNNISIYKFEHNLKQPIKFKEIDNIGKRGWNCNQGLGYVAQYKSKKYLFLASAKADHSVLQVLDLNGNLFKEFHFDDFPPPKYNNRIGLYEWLLIDEKILLASLYKSYSMNSEETFAFDFETGKQLWHIKEVGEGDYGRGFGAYGFTSYYKDSEGRLHTFFLAKDTFCHFDAHSGEFIKPPQVITFITEKVLKEKGIYSISDEDLATWTDPFSAYGSIAIEDINNDNEKELLFIGCFNAIGALDMNHNVIWWDNAPLSDLCMRYPGICDIDNDGELEIGVGHINGKFVCYSAKTGKEKWSFNLDSVTSDIVCSDIDGDGYYEFIFGTSDGRLLALGNNAKIKFELKFDSSVGSPIIADIDNDNKSEIIVLTGDSKICWVK
ncbi:MAG TPA: hypothetical protein VIR55_07350 [Ignavibacteria bacterium]